MTAILGHDAAIAAWLGAAASPRMHHGWIVAGPQGIGKATLAHAFARRLLAAASDGGAALPAGLDLPDEHPIARLIAAGTHPDFTTLSRIAREEKGETKVARNITVDQVRGLHRLIENRPALSDRRVVVIDSADDMERGAANALLKSLEEPPAGLVFLLVAHAPARLLPTIRSRCRTLALKPLDDATMRVALRRALPDAPADEIDALVAAGEGSPGRALGFAGLALGEMQRELAAIAETGDPDNSRRLALAKAIAAKAARPRYEALLERAPAFIAAAARTRQGEPLARAIAAWEAAQQLAASAIVLTLDPQATAFALLSHVAGLATARQAA